MAAGEPLWVSANVLSRVQRCLATVEEIQEPCGVLCGYTRLEEIWLLASFPLDSAEPFSSGVARLRQFLPGGIEVLGVYGRVS